MGTVVQLKNQINNSYFELKNSVEEKLVLVEEKIKTKLNSDVGLVQKMTNYHIQTGGKRLRALLTLGSAKLCSYSKGGRDINLEVLKLLSSTSSKIAQGEILQLQHKGDIDMLEETYLKIISTKTAVLFSASTKVGAILANKQNKEKDALEFYGKNLGLTFQIADDTLDYNSELKLFGKKIGNDFFEGKITLPIILLFQQINNIEKQNLKDIFKKNTRSENDLKFTLDLILKYKIIKQCYKKAEHFISLASSSLSIFPDSKEKRVLENLTTFSLERSF